MSKIFDENCDLLFSKFDIISLRFPSNIKLINSIFFISSVSFSQENVPEFPYDPDEKATEVKMCAKVCLRRRDACIRREASNPERDQICQSQMIICVNQCR